MITCLIASVKRKTTRLCDEWSNIRLVLFSFGSSGFWMAEILLSHCGQFFCLVVTTRLLDNETCTISTHWKLCRVLLLQVKTKHVWSCTFGSHKNTSRRYHWSRRRNTHRFHVLDNTDLQKVLNRNSRFFRNLNSCISHQEKPIGRKIVDLTSVRALRTMMSTLVKRRKFSVHAILPRTFFQDNAASQ